MAYTTINKSSDYFNTKLYTGNGSTQSITGVGFQPDLTWLKCRSNADGHGLFDAVRGVNKRLISDTAEAETTISGVTSFDSDGFSLGSAKHNDNGNTFVGWSWKASGSTASNTDGSITSTVSANTTAGFSIVSYTGNGTANSTIGHGLGTVPDFIIVKCRSSSGTAWGTKNPAYNSPSDPRVLYLNNSNSYDSAQNVWGTSASFTTSTFTVGDWVGSNTNGDDYIAYCWTSKTGYSKFGSYTGNGNADGTFVYTGFKPAFVIIKRYDGGTNDWVLYDTKRCINGIENALEPNTSNSESTVIAKTDYNIDLLSNGFKLRSDSDQLNNGSYIYMAFGQSLVGSNNVPCTAR